MASLNNVVAIAITSSLVSACGILESDGVSQNAEQVLVAVPPLGPAANPVMGEARVLRSVKSKKSRPIEEIFQTNRCNDLSRGGFIWFTNKAQLENWLSPLSTDLASQIQSRVNFDTQGVLLMDYGIEASPGGGVEINSERLGFEGDEAVVTVKKLNVPKGKKQVQMVTHPCSLHAIPRVGYSVLAVRNEFGDELITFENR